MTISASIVGSVHDLEKSAQSHLPSAFDIVDIVKFNWQMIPMQEKGQQPTSDEMSGTLRITGATSARPINTYRSSY